MIILGAVLMVIGVMLVACGAGEWWARREDTRVAVEDVCRTTHYRIVKHRIDVLCRYPGANLYRRQQ